MSCPRLLWWGCCAEFNITVFLCIIYRLRMPAAGNVYGSAVQPCHRGGSKEERRKQESKNTRTGTSPSIQTRSGVGKDLETLHMDGASRLGKPCLTLGEAWLSRSAKRARNYLTRNLPAKPLSRR